MTILCRYPLHYFNISQVFRKAGLNQNYAQKKA